jgi:hypothetical protein
LNELASRAMGRSRNVMSWAPAGPVVLRAFVLHWDESEVAAKAALVESAGHKVVGSEWLDGTRAVQRMKELAPDVLVVWTSHLPTHGRTTAAAMRSYAWGRSIHLLFVEADPEPLPKGKRSKLAEVLPDAVLVTPRTLAVWLGKVEAAIAAMRREV